MAAKKHVFLARTLSLLLCLALLAGLVPAALADGPEPKDNIPVTDITITPSLNLKMGENENGTVTVSVQPDDATDSSYAASITQGSDVISIQDQTGTIQVTALKEGDATITVTANDGSGKSASCSVHVDAADPKPVPVQNITLSPSTLELKPGETKSFTVTVKPDNADNRSYTANVTSGSEAIRIEDKNGTIDVIGIKAGSGTVTVTAQDGSDTSATCNITVKEEAPVPVTGITLSPTSTTLAVGANQQLTANIIPSNASNKEITWSSSAPTIASVDNNGRVTANATGSATIIAATKDGGFTATCTVTVNAGNTSVTVTPSNVTMTPNQTQQLTATVTTNSSNKTVTWSSSNNGIATVSTSGLVTAKSGGTATITATANDGSGQKATCTVTVIATSVKLNQTTASMIPYQTLQLTATVTTSNANKTVTWSSNNTSIATVTPSGLVRSTLFPHTTLFRSGHRQEWGHRHHHRHRQRRQRPEGHLHRHRIERHPLSEHQLPYPDGKGLRLHSAGHHRPRR